ncbi:MAG: hypothetical protein Q7T11_09590, partial [Deltaproteobacteria bacterium]|nr:hypothetical protein [Deltaproteobacteria bacterium]
MKILDLVLIAIAERYQTAEAQALVRRLTNRNEPDPTLEADAERFRLAFLSSPQGQRYRDLTAHDPSTGLARGAAQILGPLPSLALVSEMSVSLFERIGSFIDVAPRVLQARWERINRWLVPGSFDAAKAAVQVEQVMERKVPIREENVSEWCLAFQIFKLLEVDEKYIGHFMPNAELKYSPLGYDYLERLPQRWKQADINLADGEIFVDLGAGRGEKDVEIAKAFPGAGVIAFDGWPGATLSQIRLAEEAGLTPDRFRVALGDLRKPFGYLGRIDHVAIFANPT